MKKRVKVFLQNYVFYIKKKVELRNILLKLQKHIEECPIKNDLKKKKLEKVLSIKDKLFSLEVLPIRVAKIGLIWLELCCKNMLLKCGYTNIEEMLNILDLNVNLNKSKYDCDDNMKSYFENNDLHKLFTENIKPINCLIIKKTNKNSCIRFTKIRPALEELEGKLHGLCIEILKPNATINIFGFLTPDSLRYYRDLLPIGHILKDLKEKYYIVNDDGERLLNCLSYRDIICMDVRQITNKLKQLKEKYDFYKKSDLTILLSEFHFLDEYLRLEMITLLVEFGIITKSNYLVALIPIPVELLDIQTQKFIDTTIKLSSELKEDGSDNEEDEVKINKLQTSDKNKSKALEKLKSVKQSHDGDAKSQKYIDGFVKIPFGKIKKEPGLDNPCKKLLNELFSNFPSLKNKPSIKKLENNYVEIFKKAKTLKDSKDFSKNALEQIKKANKLQQNYLKQVEEILNTCVHGHDLVKLQIRRLIAQWISGGQSGIVIGLEGPPGNGKTTLIKNGLANCLLDENDKPRPVGFIPLGGSTNGSFLCGHGFTYQGSTWGRIVDVLMDSKCMNPILLFDELDKISQTEAGREVTGILTHLTDSTQNTEFNDRYFDGVNFDLSKAIMVFTFNDRSRIDPILLDRMTIIQTKPLTIDDKKHVCRKHLMPQICSNVDIQPSSINIKDEDIENLIYDYTYEAGARQLKRLIETLIQELNLRRLSDPTIDLTIDQTLIKDVFRYRDKVDKESISEHSIVGQINGMYANALGMGGVLPIQVSKNSTESKLELTGNQGDTMKESMKCAREVAFQLVSKEKTDFEPNKLNYGLHIHCPATSTPKDGPSAGGAICSTIYSYLMNKPIKQTIAMTGEIDLLGNITAIGGLQAKLCGAKKSGVTLAFIPKENMPHLQRIRDEGLSPEDDNFKVMDIDHITQALPFLFDE